MLTAACYKVIDSVTVQYKIALILFKDFNLFLCIKNSTARSAGYQTSFLSYSSY